MEAGGSDWRLKAGSGLLQWQDSGMGREKMKIGSIVETEKNAQMSNDTNTTPARKMVGRSRVQIMDGFRQQVCENPVIDTYTVILIVAYCFYNVSAFIRPSVG